KQVLRAYIFCGACGNNRTNRGGFQFAAARLPWFCPLRALDFGPIDELRKKHGDLAAIAPLPRAHFTKPNIVIKPNANSRPTGDTTGYLANPKEV
ncbi:hypothetical protein ABUT88_05750, partial [Escherichia coli]